MVYRYRCGCWRLWRRKLVNDQLSMYIGLTADRPSGSRGNWSKANVGWGHDHLLHRRKWQSRFGNSSSIKLHMSRTVHQNARNVWVLWVMMLPHNILLPIQTDEMNNRRPDGSFFPVHLRRHGCFLPRAIQRLKDRTLHISGTLMLLTVRSGAVLSFHWLKLATPYSLCIHPEAAHPVSYPSGRITRQRNGDISFSFSQWPLPWWGSSSNSIYLRELCIKRWEKGDKGVGRQMLYGKWIVALECTLATTLPWFKMPGNHRSGWNKRMRS